MTVGAQVFSLSFVRNDDLNALALEAQMQAEYEAMYGEPDQDPDNHISVAERVILARCGNALAGLIGWKLWPNGDGKVCLVYVVPAYRGMRLAERLVRYAEIAVWETGAQRMRFETGPKQQPAMRLYERMGYRPTEERFGFYADRPDKAGTFYVKELR